MSRPRRACDHAHRAHRRADADDRGLDLIEFGLGLQSDKSPAEYVALAQRAEAGGFDVISVYHDMFFQPAIFPLLLIANATERVRLGFAALNPSTLHPVELAGQSAALDLLSGGRAFLGIVTGGWLDQLALDERRPVQRIREAVEIVRRLHAGDRSGFAGELFTLAPGAGLEYEQARERIPLMIGTWKPRLAALAGTLANEVKIGGSVNPDFVPVMREWIGNDDVGIVVGAVTVVDEDGDAARTRAAREVEMYLDVVGRLDPTLDLAPHDPVPLDRFVLAGTPEEVATHAQRLYDAGAKRVDFGTPTGLTTAHGVDLLCDRVLPLLRQ